MYIQVLKTSAAICVHLYILLFTNYAAIQKKNEQIEITTGNVSYITSIMSNIVSLMAFEIFDLQVL